MTTLELVLASIGVNKMLLLYLDDCTMFALGESSRGFRDAIALAYDDDTFWKGRMYRQWESILSETEDDVMDADRGDLTWQQLYQGIEFNSKLRAELLATANMSVSGLNRSLSGHELMEVNKRYNTPKILAWARKLLGNSSAYVVTYEPERFMRTRIIEWILVYGLSRIPTYCGEDTCDERSNSITILHNITSDLCKAIEKITIFRTRGHRMCFREAVSTLVSHLSPLCEGCARRY
jgi:hypothetical protein